MGDGHLVQRRLRNVDQLAINEISELLRRARSTELELQKITNSLSQLSAYGDRAKRIGEELKEAQDKDRDLDKRIDDLQRSLDGARAQLATKQRELGKAEDDQRKARPALARIRLAEQVIDVLRCAQEDAMPLHITEISRVMTLAYRAMAHKKSVHRIAIDPSLNVRVLGEGGRDLRDMDSSAGESQIFALSLISAIASVVSAKLPVMMDTPLARLDVEHRMNVLDYFTDRAGEQVTLLAQPNEVYGPYLDKIRSRICARFLIEHEELGDGAGINHVQRDAYFEN